MLAKPAQFVTKMYENFLGSCHKFYGKLEIEKKNKFFTRFSFSGGNPSTTIVVFVRFLMVVQFLVQIFGSTDF